MNHFKRLCFLIICISHPALSDVNYFSCHTEQGEVNLKEKW